MRVVRLCICPPLAILQDRPVDQVSRCGQLGQNSGRQINNKVGGYREQRRAKQNQQGDCFLSKTLKPRSRWESDRQSLSRKSVKVKLS